MKIPIIGLRVEQIAPKVHDDTAAKLLTCKLHGYNLGTKAFNLLFQSFREYAKFKYAPVTQLDRAAVS